MSNVDNSVSVSITLIIYHPHTAPVNSSSKVHTLLCPTPRVAWFSLLSCFTTNSELDDSMLILGDTIKECTFLSTYFTSASPLSLAIILLSFIFCTVSPKKSTPPQRPSRKEKEVRSRPSLIDLPLPPTLAGGDSSPPQSPIRQAPQLPQPALKKRPKSVSCIAQPLPISSMLITLSLIWFSCWWFPGFAAHDMVSANTPRVTGANAV